MRSTHRFWQVAVLALGCSGAGCGLIEVRPEQLTSGELGFKTVASKPGVNWQCQSLAVRGDLLVILTGQKIILYKKGEGIFYHVAKGPSGNTQAQALAWAKDPDACSKWNLANWLPTQSGVYYALNHPSLIQTFDNAETDPQKLFSRITEGPPYFSRNGEIDGYSTISNTRRGPASKFFFEVANEMDGLRARDLYPGIETIRSSLTPQAVAKAKAERAAEGQLAVQKRRDAMNAARASFERAANQAKGVGMTLCSQDNRIAQVEQVAGARIKLLLRGRALGRYGEFGEVGPHRLGFAQDSDEAHAARPIQDDYFLFNPLSGSVRISNGSDVFWDESRYWGVCDYR